MAESIISTVAGPLKQAIDTLSKLIDADKKLLAQGSADLRRLRRELEAMQAYCKDLQKVENSSALTEMWLRDVRKLADDINKVMAEYYDVASLPDGRDSKVTTTTHVLHSLANLIPSSNFQGFVEKNPRLANLRHQLKFAEEFSHLKGLVDEASDLRKNYIVPSITVQIRREEGSTSQQVLPQSIAATDVGASQHHIDCSPPNEENTEGSNENNEVLPQISLVDTIHQLESRNSIKRLINTAAFQNETRRHFKMKRPMRCHAPELLLEMPDDLFNIGSNANGGKKGALSTGSDGNASYKDGGSLVSCDREASAVDGSKDGAIGGGGAGHGPSEAPVTSRGYSLDCKLCYGAYASTPWKRGGMEEFYDSRIDVIGGELVGLFGVYAGHGGPGAAEYVKENLFSNMIKHPKFISDTKSAIAETYTRTDSEFLKTDNNQNPEAGSTACTAVIIGNRLLIANVGDSRAVICRGGEAIAGSIDHVPYRSDERQRIEDAGGFVIWAGKWRVGGVLAISRAFGHKNWKQFVVADPEIEEEEVDDSLEFLIIASAGLWDVITNEEAVAMVRPIIDAEQAAKSLVMKACRWDSGENITCLVVRFLTAGAA